jgi:type I restriction enzyme M protein
MATRVIDIETKLWQAADELRANSNLSAQEYSVPVLGLIFLRFADYKFSKAEATVKAQSDVPQPHAAGEKR